MQINNSNNNIKFTSLMNPIKTFRFETPKGALLIKEETKKCLSKEADFLEYGRFFVKNFNDENLDDNLMKSNFSREIYNESINMYTKSCADVFKRDRSLTTMLSARDKNGNLVAAILTHPFDENPLISDNKTFYIDSIAINKDYRKCGLGKMLIDKVVEADGSFFTDIYLEALESAKKFYKKIGFNIIKPINRKNMKLLKAISMYREDYPDFMSPMTKVLNPTSSRWIDRVYEFLQ